MEHAALDPTPWMILPFVGLLGLIALAPLFFPGWWHHHYPKVAYALAALTLGYYLVGLHAYERVWHTGIEYFSFIALIGSLFVVSGGIHISVKGEATPLANTAFLGIGAIVANVLGTTGASMLLIRPWLRMNKYRITAHHVVFFIFVVSNVGGCLTPIGDPPLFLGYLKGVPFWWVAKHCWPMWLVGVGFLLAVFYLLDRRNYLRAPKAIREQLAEPADVWRFQGTANLFFLGVILVAVFIDHPPFVREFIMIGAAIGSYYTTRKHIHEANHFDFQPIREVAILFIGIFATMMPALDWLQTHATEFGQPSPTFFFWATGTLSAFLDNAPTYLSFLSTEFGAFLSPSLIDQTLAHLQAHGADPAMLQGDHAPQIQAALAFLATHHPGPLATGTLTLEQVEIALLLVAPDSARSLVAISVAAVFFGAATYIGNGPNFMVKAMAEQKRVRTPTFLGYLFKFSLPFLLPMLVLVWLLFFLRAG
jgi:Na+/H+ antiporter NhaD/arsenite permease-like protein